MGAPRPIPGVAGASSEDVSGVASLMADTIAVLERGGGGGALPRVGDLTRLLLAVVYDTLGGELFPVAGNGGSVEPAGLIGRIVGCSRSFSGAGDSKKARHVVNDQQTLHYHSPL